MPNGVIILIYGIYKNVRDASWQCLIDYLISALPVDVLKIANAAGITVRKNSDVGMLAGGESGKSVFDTERDEWYIIYDDETSKARRRLIIAHELGHIFLGHELLGDSPRRTFEKSPDFESQADAFAIRLLAPACVLKELDKHTPEEIAALCGIPGPEAEKRAERMKELYKRNRFYTDKGNLEKKVYSQFEGYINNAKGV